MLLSLASHSIPSPVVAMFPKEFIVSIGKATGILVMSHWTVIKGLAFGLSVKLDHMAT